MFPWYLGSVHHHGSRAPGLADKRFWRRRVSAESLLSDPSTTYHTPQRPSSPRLLGGAHAVSQSLTSARTTGSLNAIIACVPATGLGSVEFTPCSRAQAERKHCHMLPRCCCCCYDGHSHVIPHEQWTEMPEYAQIPEYCDSTRIRGTVEWSLNECQPARLGYKGGRDA